MVIVYPNGDIEVVGHLNPFRYTEVRKLWKKKTIVVFPSGGDDTQSVQAALDDIERGGVGLVKCLMVRKWRFPWMHRKGFEEINKVQDSIVRLSEGTFNIGEPLVIGKE